MSFPQKINHEETKRRNISFLRFFAVDFHIETKMPPRKPTIARLIAPQISAISNRIKNDNSVIVSSYRFKLLNAPASFSFVHNRESDCESLRE